MPRTTLTTINPEPPKNGGNTDWMDKLNGLVGNIKGTISEIKPMIELAKNQVPGQSQAQGGLQQFLALMRAAGYGDTPIGAIITELAPYSLNQLEELAKSKIKDKLLGGGK